MRRRHFYIGVGSARFGLLDCVKRFTNRGLWCYSWAGLRQGEISGEWPVFPRFKKRNPGARPGLLGNVGRGTCFDRGLLDPRQARSFQPSIALAPMLYWPEMPYSGMSR